VRARRISRAAWLAVAFAGFFFLALSVLLARGLGGTGAERAAVVAVIRAEARGDAAGVLSRLPACAREPACAQLTRERVGALSKPGFVQVLTYDPSVGLALQQTTGTGRVAWRVGAGLPIVQCVRVQRGGPLAGTRVELLAISAPIGRTSACP
jgi:hypothetical protein